MSPTKHAHTAAHSGRLKSTRFFRKAGLVVALVLSAGATAVAMQPKAAPPPSFQAQAALPLPSTITPLGALTATATQPYITETRIRRGDTLAAVLKRLQIDSPALQHFLTYNQQAQAMHMLYPGRTVSVAIDSNNAIQWFRYYHTPSDTIDGKPASRWLEVTANTSGFSASEKNAIAEAHVQVASGNIISSLFGATDAADVPDSIALQMADILSSKIDFIKDLRQGDNFRVVYEDYYAQGQRVGAGRILALEFKNKTTLHEAYLFKDPHNDAARGTYYDSEGKSLKGSFLRAALKYSRISSTFGRRQHPIHRNWRNHNGVDYAAPTGTPIHATADGTVEFIGTQRGYGNVIILKHFNKITTLYAHQNGFAKGLRQGDKVEQGQLIGYVGSTGWATGPHLHYEFRIAGVPKDPLSVELPIAQALDSSQQKAFLQQTTVYQNQLALLRDYQEAQQLAHAD